MTMLKNMTVMEDDDDIMMNDDGKSTITNNRAKIRAPSHLFV